MLDAFASGEGLLASKEHGEEEKVRVAASAGRTAAAAVGGRATRVLCAARRNRLMMKVFEESFERVGGSGDRGYGDDVCDRWSMVETDGPEGIRVRGRG